MTEAQDPTSKTSSADQAAESPVQPATKHRVLFIAALCFVVAGGFLFYNLNNITKKPFLTFPQFTPNPVQNAHFELKKFSSNEEFQKYLEDNTTSYYGGFGSFARQERMGGMMDMAMTAVAPMPAMAVAENNAGGQPSRVSETNVQVKGIDEPDIVKTNGKQLFLSTEEWYRYRPMPMMMEERVASAVDLIAPGMPAPQYDQAKTQVLTAFPPAELAKLAEIDAAGQLLLHKNTVIVLGNQNGQGVLTAFNVNQPVKPERTWKVRLAEGTQLVTARLKGDKLYIISQTYATDGCPVVPLYKNDGDKLSIPCTEIFYPDRSVSNANTTYTAMILNPESGDVEKTTSIVGSSGNSILYMSPTSLYLTYRGEPDNVEFMYAFLTSQGEGFFPQSVTDKVAKLRSYDISKQAKQVELMSILEGYQRSLSKDDRLKMETELQNRMKDYLKAHSRELEQTMIVKFDADSLTAESTGQVPGYLLNQFALDEYENNLRVATTFGQAWTQFGQAESASDVYVLDSSLRQRGVVQDLGKGERIYAVRFLNDKGYVVTFKQIDPFYILDLSKPDKPEKTGELKIPGYSSYLHPLSKDRIVGIGKEDNMVKISLFDVSNVSDPREIAKYTLDEYWSELLSTHHAFLLDEKHEVFFMPGSKGGYVFSYANDEISLIKAISQSQVKRALFINDYLFILGEQGITVVDEKDWQVVKELAL
jgi:inhibitor of cysteine peptidase